MDFVLDPSMFEGCFDVLVEAGSPVITTFICLSLLMTGVMAIFDMIQIHFSAPASVVGGDPSGILKEHYYSSSLPTSFRSKSMSKRR